VYVATPLAAGAEVVLPPAPSQHLAQVLRLGVGHSVTLFNGDGRDYPGRILNANRTATRVACESTGHEEPQPVLRIHLGLGISKGERMDFAIQKAVELGVAEVSPLLTDRSVVRLAPERQANRLSHWEGIVIAACEQSGRSRVPILRAPIPLDAWLARGHPNGIVLDPISATPLPAIPPPLGEIVLLVGPEGGLGPAEQAAAHAAGFTPVRLGPRILRTETAPLAAIAAIQALWGDFARSTPALPVT